MNRRLRNAMCTLMSGTLTLSAGLVLAATPHADALTSQGENIVPRPAGALTADALPTVQINAGVVWDQAIVGNTVFVGGEFAQARPAGAAVDTQLMPRKNLLAYDITTGVATSWAPAANGGVTCMALSPDKSRLYIGGKFTDIDGTTRNRIAAFDTATGALVSSFAPDVDGEVSAITATNDTVYLGGFFSSVNGVSRTRLAAVSTTGALLGWAPTADSYVRGMALTNDGKRLVIGGSFGYVNGAFQPGTASLDPVTGTMQSWAANKVITNNGNHAGIYGLRNDGNSIKIAAWSYSDGRAFEGAASLDQSTGNILWMADCHGDSYDVATIAGVVYTASHHHNCSNIGYMPEQTPANYQRLDGFQDKATFTVKTNSQSGYINYAGQPAPSAVSWFPRLEPGTYTGQQQAAWSLATDGRYLAVGGEFPSVNNVAQQGLTRFAVDSIAPKKMGPRFSGLSPRADVSGRTVRFSWQANADWDGVGLTYNVYRLVAGSTKELVGTVQQDAQYWNRPTLSVTDYNAKPNTTYQYWARAVDADGNTKDSTWIPVTTGDTGAGAYSDTIKVDVPTHYWRMNEASGTSVKDEMGGAALALRSGATLGAAAFAADTMGTALATNGNQSSGYGVTATSEAATAATTVEAWVKTTSTSGGKIVGLGNTTGTTSSTTDRNLYLTSGGTVAWGLYSGGTRKAVASTQKVNDGQWHHVAGTLSSDGAKLYVDGKLASSDATITSSTGLTGYWHVGCDTTSQWPSAPSSKCLTGSVDEVAVYNRALDAATIAGHVKAATPNIAPTAAFSSSCDATGHCSVDGSASTDSDGTVASYAWDFGDGSTATGATAQHAYTKSGNYQVSLTVTDNQGATNTLIKTVAVTLPNKAPVAAIKSSCVDLDCVFDGGNSTDEDGVVSAWAWDFGDGTTATGKEAPHTYAKGGTYLVTLTVTDDQGATNTLSRQVVINAPGDTTQLMASDTFDTVQTRWGNADIGGAWSYASPSSFTTDGKSGLVTAAKSVSSRASLNDVQLTDSSSTVDMRLGAVTTGGGLFTRLEARSSSTSCYWAFVRWAANGTQTLTISKKVNGVQTDLKTVTLPGTYTAADTYRLRFTVTGTGTTSLQATLWKVGDAEPATPTLQASDASPELQVAGAPAVSTYLSGSATESVQVAFDNLAVTTNN